MYVTSKYNVIFSNEKKFCLLNTLTGKMAVLKDQKALEYIIDGRAPDDEDPIAKKLLEDGFLVRTGENEDAIAEVKYLDIVANKELYLVLMPTSGCNFRCEYCYENNPESVDNFAMNKMTKDIQAGVVNFVQNSIKVFYGLFVEWYGGEPLTCADVIDDVSKYLIDICQKRGKPYYSTLTTNGFLLNEEMFRRCLNNHIYSFHITIDGFESIHDKFRHLENGKGTQSVILENLRSIRDNVKSQYFKIILRTNVSKELLPRLDEWMQFLYEEFAWDNRFRFFFRPIEDRGGTAVENVKNSVLTDLNTMYDTMINSAYKLDFGYIQPFLYNSVCSAAKRNRYIIDPCGTVKKCGEYLEDPRSTVGKLDTSGHMILDRNALAMWIEFKDKMNNGKCSECKSRVSCFNRNCPMRQGIMNSDNSLYCGVENQYISRILDLLTERDYEFIKYY